MSPLHRCTLNAMCANHKIERIIFFWMKKADLDVQFSFVDFFNFVGETIVCVCVWRGRGQCEIDSMTKLQTDSPSCVWTGRPAAYTTRTNIYIFSI